MSALSDLLNGGTVTARQAADKAAEMKIDLPYGTIAAYWSGGHGRPTAGTLAKLAEVVPFTEKQLQLAAWSAAAPLGKWIPPEESILLDRRTRRALDNLIKSVVAMKVGSNVVEATPQPDAPSEAGKAQEVSARPAVVDHSEVRPPVAPDWRGNDPRKPAAVGDDEQRGQGDKLG